MQKLCEYGCGEEAEYQFGNGKWCCSDRYGKCPATIEKRKTTMAQVGDDGLTTFQRAANKIAENRGLEGYKKSTIKTVATKRATVNKDGLDVFQQGAKNTAEKRKNDIDENGLDSYERGGIKARKTGKENGSYIEGVQKRQELYTNEQIQEAYQKTCQIRYGDNYKELFQEQTQAVIKEKYGVDNVFQLPEIKEKIKETMRERYGVDYISQSPMIKQKIYKTGIENGTIMPIELRDSYDLYREVTKVITTKNWLEYYDIINPLDIKRGSEWHLDHIFSQSEGFKNNIPPYIIGHWTNLQVLPHAINESKAGVCWKSQVQLFEDYFKEVKSAEAPFLKCFL